MKYYIITLKSKEVSTNFIKVSNHVMGLISHLLRHIDKESKIILTRHQLPVGYKMDKRVIDIDCSDLPIPNNKQEMMVDKTQKLLAAYNYVKENGYGITMQIDYDDSVSKKLIDIIQNISIGEGEGYFLKKGFIYPEGSSWIYKENNIHKRCGSTWIIRWRKEDFDFNGNEIPRVIKWGHHELISKLPSLKFKISGINFPSIVYRTDSGENYTDIRWSGWHGKKQFIHKIINIRYLTNSIKNEFGVS